MHFSAFASCPKGVELLLQEEIHQFQIHSTRQTQAGVYFDAESLEQLYYVCYHSRLASRIFLLVETFEFKDNQEYYTKIKNIDWGMHFTQSKSFMFKAVTKKSIFDHSTYAAQLAKDAYCDHWREQFDTRPNVDFDEPQARIHIIVNREQAEVSIDLIGEGMHRRGYRTESGAAPLRENLACAILKRAGWTGQGDIADLFCGSGTLLIEALLMAKNVASGKHREHWTLENWNNHNKNIWQKVKQEAALAEKDCDLIAYANDIDPNTLDTARENAKRAGVEDLMQFSQLSIHEWHKKMNVAMVVSNPPYGERLNKADTEELYAALGDVLKQYFIGAQGAIYTSEKTYAKKLGIAWNRNYNIPNANIDCQVYTFDLVEEKFREQPNLDIPAANWESFVDASSEAFLNRLKKNIKLMDKWARKNDVHAYRIYDADIPEFSVAIDRYNDCLHIQEYAAPKSVDEKMAIKRFQQVVRIASGSLNIPINQIFTKVRLRQKGKAQYEKALGQQHEMIVVESELQFKVNLAEFLDTGLFLDSRQIRQYILANSADKKFLNLFAYTGTASVYAKAGGAKKVSTVDLSQTYLSWAKENMALNGFDIDHTNDVIRADCTVWLEQNKNLYDLILLDPPTFSNSKKMQTTFDVQRDQETLVKNAMNSLTQDGELIFVNNYRKFRISEELTEAFDVEEMRNSLPKDFERKKIHNAFIIKHRK
jgi:23S rRNA (guanine2445-N2)-methyltransferase / 23S rRNA (guanine2069-N7)-methyltransferase